MRRSANPVSSRLLLGVAVGSVLLLSGTIAQAASASGPLNAILRPVNRDTGTLNPDISLGTARFSQGSDKVDILLQVFGISVGGNEQGAAPDGTGNNYPHTVQIVPGTCEAVVKGKVAGSQRLPDLQVRSDGSGTLFASTSTPLAKLSGQSIVIWKPGKPGGTRGVPDACGVLKAE